MGAADRRRTYSDTKLERMFPEHPWRDPVPVRVVEWPGQRFLACRFCLYRRGLVPPRRTALYVYPVEVEHHLAQVHPVNFLDAP